MISELLQASVIIGILHSGIRLATPYLYAALGETVAQRSGVLNLGVDGIMLMGAFSASTWSSRRATCGWAWPRPSSWAS